MNINYGFDFRDMEDKDIIEILDGLKNLDSIDSSSNTPLLWACKDLKLQVVKYLVIKGVDVNFVNDCGEAPLHEVISISEQNEEVALGIISILIDAGADLELRAYMEKTPFLKACSRNSLPVLKLLVKFGCNTKAVVVEGGKELDGCFYSSIFSNNSAVKEFVKNAVST